MRRVLGVGVLLGLLAAMASLLLAAGAASATIDGGCTGSATDSAGKAVPATIDLATADHWNVSKDSTLTGQGTAPKDQTAVSVSGVAFGFGLIPIASGHGHGTTGSASLDVSKYSSLARVIAVSGTSDSCTGHLVVEVTDEAVLDTLAGKASVALLAIGVLGLLGVGFRKVSP